MKTADFILYGVSHLIALNSRTSCRQGCLVSGVISVIKIFGLSLCVTGLRKNCPSYTNWLRAYQSSRRQCDYYATTVLWRVTRRQHSALKRLRERGVANAARTLLSWRRTGRVTSVLLELRMAWALMWSSGLKSTERWHPNFLWSIATGEIVCCTRGGPVLG